MPDDLGRKLCAPGRTRTCDRLLRRQLLYPLSYGRPRTIVHAGQGCTCPLTSTGINANSFPQKRSTTRNR